MPKSLLAKDIMHKKVICLAPTMSVKEASKILTDNQISGAPVISEAGEILGVLSHNDLVRKAFTHEFTNSSPSTFYIGYSLIEETFALNALERLEKVTVEEAMHPDVLTVERDEPTSRVASKMRENKVHRVLVVENGKLQGIITSFDLLALL